MPSQPIADLFLPEDARMQVLAFCVASHDRQRQLGSWVWLLEARHQAKGLLYTGAAPAADLVTLHYAAIAALGGHLGLPAQVLAFLPSCPGKAFGMPQAGKPFYAQIQENFDIAGKDIAKSRLNLGPEILASWPGYRLLRAIAGGARKQNSAAGCQILERCPACGEFRLAGACGCDFAHLLLPSFQTLASPQSPVNLTRRHTLQGWRGQIDYTRTVEKCPACNGPLIPLWEGQSAWKCAACGLERGCGDLFSPSKVISLPKASLPEPSQPPALPELAVRSRQEIASLPARLLERVSGLYPEIWKRVDQEREAFLDDKGKLPWDASIFLPGSHWKAILREYHKNYGAPASARAFYRLMSAGSWRPGQDIYVFDPALYEALCKTPFEGRLPYGQLSRFPAWCIYFDAPGLEVEGQLYGGFFAWLDEAFGHQHLCLYYVGEEREYFLQPIRLGDWDLKQGFLLNLQNSPDKSRLALLAAKKLIFDPGIVAALNLLLYALTQTDAGGVKTVPQRPEPRKTKKGWRLFAPPRPNFRILGEDLGQQLRQAARVGRAGQRSGPCPHIRRGHWHHFWKGPRKSVLDLKWLPPIPVALAEAE